VLKPCRIIFETPNPTLVDYFFTPKSIIFDPSLSIPASHKEKPTLFYFNISIYMS
jgi:hypothetical protein